MSKAAADLAEDTQAQILEAATERFRHYGYRKTTMADVAGDCSMSAGNLYRYFESKSDIGAAVSVAWFAALYQIARAAIAQPGLSPRQKLEAYVLTVNRFTVESLRNTPHIQEMVNFLCEERRDLVESHLGTCHEIVAAILEDGVKRGAFEIADIATTARAVLNAILRFEYPPLLALSGETNFDEEVRALVSLIVEGLGGGRSRAAT
ncbi:MAG: TetR/AcrR family transcriptional regulator [Alphaproteobacteria bacterium]|nr:TetR/AcrR family transcriptional regulator [Alphaproteobacteria bacterium]